MAYVIEIGALNYFGSEITDYNVKDIYNIYNDKDEAKDAYNKLTDDYVRHFLEKELFFEESDIGYYKKLIGWGQPTNVCRWYFDEEESE